MTTPGVQVACDALRADAGIWSAAADAVQAAARTAANLTLADKLGQLPGLAGSGKSLAGYDELRQKMATALAVGAGVFRDVSAILVQVADTFEQEDALGAHNVEAGGDR